MSAYPWLSREEWAARFNDVYTSDVHDVEDCVSMELARYATDEEAEAAIVELAACWKALGRDLIAANRAAKAVFPLRDQPAAPGWMAALMALTAEQQAVLEEAEAVKGQRRGVREVAGDLTSRFLPDPLATMRAGAVDAPTFHTIMGRYAEARKAAGDAYAAERRNRVPDDAAWARELERRAEIDAWRAGDRYIVQ